MIKFRVRACIALSLVLALLAPNQVARAHTGYSPIPIFTFTTHPDFPMEDFAAGHLGILLQSYDPRFLFAAYRNLTGANFTNAEVFAMKRSWEPLLNIRYKSSVGYERHDPSWKEKWFRMRLQPGADPAAREQFERQIHAESYLHKDGHYVFFENCAVDAFRNALLTLRTRERVFGKHSPRVQSWLAAQDDVFENCSDAGRASGTHVPVAVATREPAVDRQDRAYQIAAAHFYRGDFEEAVARFSVIAQDSTSPWRGSAPYLVGRALLRQAQFDAPRGRQFDATRLDAAAAAFRSVIADKSRREWYEPAANLLAFIEIRRDPSTACSQLAARIAKRGSLSGSAQSLTDYLYLVNESREDSLLPNKVCSPRNDLTDWLQSFSGSPSNSFQHSYSRWKETGSPPWLLAALANASKDSAQTEELLAAANNVPHGSPAFWTARFYRERVLVQKGRFDIVRQELDEDLRHAEGLAAPLNQSSKNLLLALRARASANLEDFLRFAIRTPSTLVYMDEYNTQLTADDKDPRDLYMRQQFSSPHFDDDAGAVINNYLSLPQLAEAAQSSSLPSNVRREIALTAFTRAIVTQNASLAEQIARTAIQSAPDANDDLTVFLNARTKQEKDFAAVWLILHHPEMQPALETGTTRATAAGKIDSFQNNWWAHFRFQAAAEDNDPEYLYYLRWWKRLPIHLKPVFPEGNIPAPSFVSKADSSAVRTDWNKLEHLPRAGDWLASRTLHFARSNPGDPRIPEALHLAVRATRFGGTDDYTPNYSKQAFQLLHKKYPNNEWTKKTPYWF